MVKCPRCGSEAKDFRKQWNYQQLSVKLFDCPKCEKTFRHIIEMKSSHTLFQKPRNNITDFLHGHDFTEDFTEPHVSWLPVLMANCLPCNKIFFFRSYLVAR